MFIFSKKAVHTAIFSMICILLAGCGDSPQPVQDTGGQRTEVSVGETLAPPEDEISYVITETELPLSEDALTQDILRGDNWVAREKETRFWNGSLYCLSDLFEIVEGTNFFVGSCIQVLAPPYDHWENQAIVYMEEEDNGLWVESLAGTTENGVLLEMLSQTDKKSYLAQLEWNGGLEVLLEMPVGLRSANVIWGTPNFWYQEGEKYWAFSDQGKTLTVFDETGQQESRRDLTGTVAGTLENPASGEQIWYGFDQKELVLWDEPGGQVLARITDQIDQKGDFAISYSPTGELFLADVNRVWSYDENTVREAFAFGEMDCFLQELYSLGFREDGVLLFLARCDDSQCLLTAEIGSAPEKQEVFIVVNNQNSALEKLVARYNRKSQEYHVTLTAAMEETEPAEYRMRIQTEMVTGGGPDLVGDWTVDIQDCVDQGYLELLDEVIEDRSSFLASALATGERNGELYGIPYECYPYFLTVSRQLADAQSWTLEQMYEAVQSSPAETMEAGITGVQMIMAYGLHDEENKAFIDWEKGESHLAEEPFLELMAFAKEYADKGGYPRSEEGERLADRRIAARQIVLNSPDDLKAAEACFNGEAACIGYPRESGSGIYMEAQRLYLNRNAGNREGAIDFLRYLISEEGQRRYMHYSALGYDFMDYSFWTRLPVRRNLVQKGLDEYQRNPPKMEGYYIEGVYYKSEKLDEEQVEVFWRILDNAVPAVFRSDDIWFIVDEELQPYFNNVRSAEEAAAVLHSRVQLYLDERK